MAHFLQGKENKSIGQGPFSQFGYCRGAVSLTALCFTGQRRDDDLVAGGEEMSD